MRIPHDLPQRKPRKPRSRRANRGRIILAVVLGLLVVGLVSARAFASFYIDFLWFDSVGRRDVFTGVLGAKLQLALGFSLLATVFALLNLTIADRLSPFLLPDADDEKVVARYRALGGRQRLLLRVLVSVLLGLLAGLPAAAQWQSWLLFRHEQSFGSSDPLFGVDIGFYVFRLPFLQFVVGWLFAAFVMITLLTAGVHYLNGAIRFQAGSRGITYPAKVQLSILFALLALLKAAGYWLDRFDLTRSRRGVVQGATYTDVKAQLPALNLLILICLAIAVLFLVNIRRRGWRVPVLAVGIWAVVAVAAGTIYPAVIQRFVVQPNVSTRESPYIGDNIAATRAAMNIDDVTQVAYTPSRVEAAEVEANAAALEDVRLLDPRIMRERFSLDQGLRAFYAINDLDVDRYEVDGRMQQVLVASRELSPDNLPNKTWVSRHLLYTHGCDLVAAPASRVDDSGRPDYFELDVDRPQIYFGDAQESYAVVRTDQDEQPCPDEEAAPYEGDGGIRLNSTLRRLAFAVEFSEYNLFGSRLISDDSRVMMHRSVKERVEKVAPFLHVDSDPYPVVVDGQIQWVVDAYTTTNRYPYAQQANTDQLSDGSGLDHSFNYVRNSVKAVVDAYDGTVTLYVVDPEDPLIQAWVEAFPDMFRSMDAVPDELLEHFRYPEDLFRVQTNQYGKYQLDTADEFFNRDAAWSVAQSPSREPEAAIPTTGGTETTQTAPANESDLIDVADADVTRFTPYYTLFHAPGSSDEATFSMLRPFVPFSSDDSRKELRSFMTVSSDPETYGQLTLYQVAEPLPPGPATVAAEIDSEPAISQQITLLGQQGSRVQYGDLQLVPVGDGLVYVRPFYVLQQGRSNQAFLRFVVAWYDNEAVIDTSLAGAIAQLFPGFERPLGGVAPDDTTDPTDTADPAVDERPIELLRDAQALFEEAEQELTTGGDLGAYQDKVEEAQRLVRQAVELLASEAAAGGTPAETPTTAAPSDSTP